MTRDKAWREAQKRWGKRAAIRAGQHVTSPDKRERAKMALIELRARKEALEREKEERLKALDWLQNLNVELRAMTKQLDALRGEMSYYKFSVGSIDNVIGAFHIKGQGDTWEEAFDAAVGK